MKVSKDSWHYRLIEWWPGDAYCRSDLCSYMRGLALSFLGMFGIYLCIGGLIPIFAVTYWLGLTPLATGLVAIVGYVVIWEICGSVIGTMVFWEDILRPWLRKRQERKWREQDFPPKAPNIFKEWVKAKKHKICPLIEFD